VFLDVETEVSVSATFAVPVFESCVLAEAWVPVEINVFDKRDVVE